MTRSYMYESNTGLTKYQSTKCLSAKLFSTKRRGANETTCAPLTDKKTWNVKREKAKRERAGAGAGARARGASFKKSNPCLTEKALLLPGFAYYLHHCRIVLQIILRKKCSLLVTGYVCACTYVYMYIYIYIYIYR
jgi:hypothetical protein